jgi:pimeloyl-ACP methyl ester carboxylesterase
MTSAEMAGKLLAKAIVATPAWRFTLAGHSLGARVVHFALTELARQRRKRIENAYLLGGAVGGGCKDDPCWELATSAVKGRIYNCFSGQDEVLQWAYRGANAMLSEPVGFSGINLRHERIFDFDCSALVTGHAEWKNQFGEILRQLDAY